jgi:hypothetical protein
VALEGTEAGLDHVRLACYGAIAFRRAAGGWTVRVPAFPSISAHAESQGQAQVNALRGVTAMVDELVALDLDIPRPSTGPLSTKMLCLPSALALRIGHHNERTGLAKERRPRR